jgi:hypothetical protein
MLRQFFALLLAATNANGALRPANAGSQLSLPFTARHDEVSAGKKWIRPACGGVRPTGSGFGRGVIQRPKIVDNSSDGLGNA